MTLRRNLISTIGALLALAMTITPATAQDEVNLLRRVRDGPTSVRLGHL